MAPFLKVRGRRPWLLRTLIGLAGLAFVATMVTIVTTLAIWPGEAKLVAPLLCPDDQGDAYVVTDTSTDSSGDTSTSFTLYCMGPRGDITDVGWGRPFGLLLGFHAGLLVALTAALSILGALLRRRRRRSAGPLDAEDLSTSASAPY